VSERAAQQTPPVAGGEAQQRPSRTRTVLQAVVGLGLAAFLIVWALPRVAHTQWSDIWLVLTRVPPSTAGMLVIGVIGGLYCYTFTLTGSLPGLRHWQALIVNVAGSSVGNLLPGGGAAGLAATYTICRTWGFSRRDISTSAIVTGVWNVLSRMALPIIAILGLATGSSHVPHSLRNAAIAGSITGVAVLGLFVSVLVSERAALAIGHGIDWLLSPLTHRHGTPRTSVRSLVVDLRARISGVVRRGWLSMTLGLVGYFGVYFLLFLLCMHTTGVELYRGQLFAAYAIGRLLTAVGVTPGGLGVTESATSLALVAWGADPAEAVAGTLLFSVFTHVLEVPLGAIGWVAWSLSPKKTPPESLAVSA
jgi:putative heme transporter